MTVMTPREIVAELDRHIIGQDDAKRAVAIALRNRWRRSKLAQPMQAEVTPKNILMIGPTGVGKTEIARRLARLANAPFIKVEATKFTEVGYVGREVESIIRDLADAAVKMMREVAIKKVHHLAKEAAQNRILDILLPQPRQYSIIEKDQDHDEPETRKKFRHKLEAGELDLHEIEIEVKMSPVGVEIMAPPGMEEMTSQLQNMFQNISGDRRRKRTMKVREALRVLTDEEAASFINEDELRQDALHQVEQHGIVFIDEIDKVARRGQVSGADVSREGVQRDLLPLVEGCTINTKYGMIRTDHILFIASGAFHLTKPSDLIPELQGRLPIRVELSPLNTEHFVRILTEPKCSLTEQYVSLLETEGLTLRFIQSGIQRIAEIAWRVNETTENIGARRLHTVMERLLDSISYTAPDQAGTTVEIDEAYVEQQLGELADDQDLSRYIL